jgi:hypothetical protein
MGSDCAEAGNFKYTVNKEGRYILDASVGVSEIMVCLWEGR